MKAVTAILMTPVMIPLVLISEGACEKHHHYRFNFSHMTHKHTHMYTVYVYRHTCYEDGGPTYRAVNVRVAGWVDGEVWMEVKLVHGQRWGGV